MANVILRLPDVKGCTGLSRSEIYRRESEGTFPSRIKLGARCVGWLQSDIDDWIEARIRESRTAGGANEAS